MHTGEDITTSAIHGKSPILYPGCVFSEQSSCKKCHLSAEVMLTPGALIPHSVKPLAKPICLIANVYILQKLKLNKKH